jgi:hypothetical protein
VREIEVRSHTVQQVASTAMQDDGADKPPWE